ncbi:hypothetical protein PV327_001605 [Microctonus hyperodae]|uniref:LisH domain-containing protein n=1 Tax=Microctonus hyperodae TaxID=165561 RepID=A0AA39FE65_MICHY|nr:hypothetical protein PV327_001605 [Microctonus hyperodae]
MDRYIEEVMNPLTSGRLLSYNEIAAKLLNERFILTALELHAELCEAGKELPILKDYFGNPNNLEIHNVKPESYTSIVRSSSQATLDSLDMTRYSEDGGGADERVAILEFELRKARENISALRANLTVMTDSESTSPNKVNDKIQSIDSPIKPHEQRALNFLVNEYLLAQSYKLTSITFSDENENQDFEDWQDVGLNIPKPSNLLQIYREFHRRNDSDKPQSVDASIQVHIDDSVLINSNEIIKKNENVDSAIVEEQSEFVNQQLTCLEEDKYDAELVDVDTTIDVEILNDNSCAMNESSTEIIETEVISDAINKFEMVEPPHQETFTVNQEADDEEDSTSAVLSLGDTVDTDPSEKDWTRIQLPKMQEVSTPLIAVNLHAQHIPELFKQEVLAHSLINTCDNDTNTMDVLIHNNDTLTLESLTDLLATILPSIVPYIALNKRDQAIPLILNAIKLNHEATQRNKLLQLLFNLKKKPQQAERNILLKTLVSLMNIKDGPIEPEEIITVCWEQSQHKYPEKRLLAVECCSAFAPYTSSAIKNSLMISMLQQILLEDKEPVVRVAVIRTLALLVAFNDDPDKYFQCEELALAALDDESSQVFDVSSAVLLPILAQWALSLKRLLSHLLTRIISKLKILLKQNLQLHCTGNDHRSSIRAMRLISVLKILLPHMIVCIVDNSIVKSQIHDDTPCELSQKFSQLSQYNLTNPLIFVDSNENFAKIINTFLANNWENEMWPEFEWLNNKFLPDVIEMLKYLTTSQEIILNCLLTYIESLCIGLGRYVTIFGVKKIIEVEIIKFEKKLTNSLHDRNELNNHLTLIPAHMLILSIVNIEELSNSLKHFIVMISNSGLDTTCLIIAIRILLKQPKLIEQIITDLWDGVVHQSASVRSTTATLFGNIIENIPEQMVTARVSPAIITLASDSDILVRASAVTAIGKLITDCAAKEAKDKGRLTLESIVKEMDDTIITHTFSIALVSTLANIVPNSPQHYIEDIIVAQLTRITSLALRYNQGVELTIALLAAYSLLVYNPLNIQCVTNVLLPGLGNLETLINHHLPQQIENVRVLIREAESKLNPTRSMGRSTSGLSLSLTAANVGQGVEDMRQRMTKIFTPKSHSSSMPSIFRKKESK